MNIRELELFRHLSTSLHFGRTSMECNITPSGLSRTIQRLESEVGAPLFHRNNRSVRLSPAGLLFREYCEQTITGWHLFRNNLKSDRVLRGELSIYCTVTASFSILPQIFKRFRTTHPEVTIRVQTGDEARALPALQGREVDIAIAAQPDRLLSGVAFIELLQTPLVFIYPRHFPQTIVRKGDSVDWSKTPVILASRGLSRTRAEKWFAEMGVRPYIYSQVSGNEAIISMVAMGCGVGIVPELVLQKSNLVSDVEILELSPHLTPFTVAACMLTKDQNNKVVKSFWSIVESETESQTISQ